MALWTGSACRINISRIESDPLTPYLSRYFLLIVHCYSELDEFKTATETGKYTGRPSAIVILSDWVCFTFTKFLHQGFYCYLQSSFLRQITTPLYLALIDWYKEEGTLHYRRDVCTTSSPELHAATDRTGLRDLGGERRHRATGQVSLVLASCPWNVRSSEQTWERASSASYCGI